MLFNKQKPSDDVDEIIIITRATKNDTVILRDGESLVVRTKDSCYGAPLKDLAEMAARAKDADDKKDEEFAKYAEQIQKPLLETIKNLTENCARLDEEVRKHNTAETSDANTT